MKALKKRFLKALCLTICIALFLTSMPTTFADETESVCVCDEHCTPYHINKSCPVCSEDRSLCQGGLESSSSSASEPVSDGEEGEDDSSNSGSKPSGNQIDDSYLNQIGDLQQQQTELQNEQDRLNQLIANAQNEKQKQQIIASNIDAQISLTKKSISLLEQKILLTEKNMQEKEKQIDVKEAEIQDGMELFRERIRAIYLSGGNSATGNYMSMLLSSQSITEFLTRTEMIKRVSEHDNELIADMRSELDSINDQKKEVEQQKRELLAEKDKLAEEQSSLESNYMTAAAALQDISAMESEYLANREVIEAQMKEIQNEIANIYAVYNSQYTDYVGGELAWPVPGFSNITCYYGWRWNNSDFHTGIDISGGGVYGANIIAANTGTVMYVRTGGYASGYSGGYGSYLIIDHGGGISTLYAHCSAIYVNEGDVVAKGQPIAAVGSTGWSTGPHLHFEVRVDGEDVDPLPYVTG